MDEDDVVEDSVRTALCLSHQWIVLLRRCQEAETEFCLRSDLGRSLSYAPVECLDFYLPNLSDSSNAERGLNDSTVLDTDSEKSRVAESYRVLRRSVSELTDESHVDRSCGPEITNNARCVVTEEKTDVIIRQSLAENYRLLKWLNICSDAEAKLRFKGCELFEGFDEDGAHITSDEAVQVVSSSVTDDWHDGLNTTPSLETGDEFGINKIYESLKENYTFQKWLDSCSLAEANVICRKGLVDIDGFLSASDDEVLSEGPILNISLVEDSTDVCVYKALEHCHALTKQWWLIGEAETRMGQGLVAHDPEEYSATISPDSSDPVVETEIPFGPSDFGKEAEGSVNEWLEVHSDLLPEISGPVYGQEELKSRSNSTWSSSISHQEEDILTRTVEVQTEQSMGNATEQYSQTDQDAVSQEVQTEGEIVECCQCSAFSFKPLGEQFVIRLKEEMSQRISLENLARIVERDAWNVRHELMDERETVVRLHAEASDLKGELAHAKHISADLKTRNDELETSLEGARNMINRLEQQMSNTTYFNSGIDYMLEAKLSQGRAVEAIAKVEVLQNELLHSQSEVGKLLEQLNKLSQEKNQMVSSSVHRELLQVAEDKVKDAELRSLQLENEVFALKEETKQLKSLSSSSVSADALTSAAKPYKFMFTEQIDPYKEMMSLKYDMLNLKTASLGQRPVSPLSDQYASQHGTTESNSLAYSSYGLKGRIEDLYEPEASLPDVDAFLPIEQSSGFKPSLSSDKFNGSPLIATGSDSEDSDWSQDSSDEAASPSRTVGLQSLTPSVGFTHSLTLPAVQTEARAVGRGVSLKPPIAPKPRSASMHHPELLSPGVYQPRTPSFITGPRSEKAVSFEQEPTVPSLYAYRRPKGPGGRQRPARFTSTIS